MKKLSPILMALVLILTFSQCKKSEIQPANDMVMLIFSPTNSNVGSRTTFDPTFRTFAWSGTECLYVGGSNHTDCLGVLSGTVSGGSISFTGSITQPTDGETLYFFYLGNNQTGDPVTTLDFSNQTGTLQDVTNYHIAIGSTTYYEGITNYSAELSMKMAIAYFDLSGFVTSNNAETVYLRGDQVYTSATVNYQTGTITGAEKGWLKMGTATAGNYVALIPSVTTETTLKFDSNSKTGTMTFLRGIQAKKFYSDSGSALEVPSVNAIPSGALPGIFSVSSTKKVRFASGNVQAVYNGSSFSWIFAPHQYDCIGEGGGNTMINGSSGHLYGVGTVDLFGWSTPYTYYGISDDFDELFYEGEFKDWGIHYGNNWRTPLDSEWSYLFWGRANASGKYAMGRVNNGVMGLIVLPDDWTLPSGLSFTSGINNYNNYTTDQWNQMEANGAMFLPAAGYRSSDVIYYDYTGYYWSSEPYYYESSAYGIAEYTYFLRFGDWCFEVSEDGEREQGMSVRLIRDIE